LIKNGQIIEETMMKKMCAVWSSVLLVMVLWSGTVMAQGPQKEGAETGALKISITGFNNDRGSARIALCNSKEDFKKKGGWFRSDAAPIKGGRSEWTFTNLPFGTYAVKAYHDENDNGKLDSNTFGAPKEQYGFSNNVRATFGPPSFEDARFTIDKAEVTITIAVE
jgi:uncharacterized protein (DUF2141 family)